MFVRSLPSDLLTNLAHQPSSGVMLVWLTSVLAGGPPWLFETLMLHDLYHITYRLTIPYSRLLTLSYSSEISSMDPTLFALRCW